MSRFLLSVSIFALALGAGSAFAQQQYNNPYGNDTAYIGPEPGGGGTTPYSDFANDFIYGGQEGEEEEGGGSGGAFWQYDPIYRGGGKHGYGGYITNETTQEGNTTIKKRTYHPVSQYDPIYRQYLQTGKLPPHITQTTEDDVLPGPEMLLPNGTQYIYFTRNAETKNNEAVLRMTTPVAIDGCADIVPPAVSLRKSGNMMLFKIEDGAVALDKTKQYYHFQCDNRSSTAYADITLNRDELAGGKVKALTFQSQNGVMDIYNIEMKPDRIELVPKTSTAFRPLAGLPKGSPLAYNFYPDNTIILFAPSAPRGEDLSAEIATFAQSKGLVESPVLKSGSGHYFIDQGGTLAGSLDFNANAFVGTVNARETFAGPNGLYQREKPVDVYAKRPGQLD